MTIAERGDPDGFPVFLLHGTPGSRFVGQANASAYASVGARVITYDQPGYGSSDRFRGRRVVDSVADVSAIADSLGIDRFAVIGGSWGGPHGLAVAALDSDLIIDGPGESTAFGHVVLNLVTLSGSITFDGGTGVFSGFHASAAVTYDGVWHWDGTYSITPPGQDE